MSTFNRIFWLITSVIMIIVGILCFFNPDSVMLTLAWFLGAAVLLDGISSICYFCGSGKENKGSGWLLFDGILSIILGFIVLFSNASTMIGAIIPIMYSIWIICKGILGVIHSCHTKTLGWSSWWILFIISIIIIILGVLAFIHPIISVITIAIMIGLFFLISGILSLAQWFAIQ